MFLKFFLLAYLLQLAIATPQFITYKDGQFGVNFGGYHAEAGLGGLLTGNAAHGGLRASAGTPHGQSAGAGLGGSVDGDSSGILYAGAQANPQTGAGAVLGGDTSRGGFMGSQAYGGGKKVISTKSYLLPNAVNGQGQVDAKANTGRGDFTVDVESMKEIEKPQTPLQKHYKKKNERNHADDVSTVVSVTKNQQKTNDENNDDIGDNTNTAAAKVKSKTTYESDLQVPETISAIENNAKGITTTNGVKHISNQQSAYAENPTNEFATTSTIIVNSKQLLRQKTHIRPHIHPKKLYRQLQRERLAHLQRIHEKEIEADAEYKQKQKNFFVQQYAQIYHTPIKSKTVVKELIDYPAPAPLPETQINIRPAVVTSALNIPIGILRSLQESLSGLGAAKQGKTVEIIKY